MICNLRSQLEHKYCKIVEVFLCGKFCLMMALYISLNMENNNINT